MDADHQGRQHQAGRHLTHGPEKWEPVFGQGHAQNKIADDAREDANDYSGHRQSSAVDRPRIDAIPVALPLKAPMKMAGVTITRAENLIVRVELQDGQVGWGEAPSAPTMTGDTLGGLVAAVRDHLAPLLIGKDIFGRSTTTARCCSVRLSATQARIRPSRWHCSMPPAARRRRKTNRCSNLAAASH